MTQSTSFSRGEITHPYDLHYYSFIHVSYIFLTHKHTLQHDYTVLIHNNDKITAHEVESSEKNIHEHLTQDNLQHSEM